MNEIQLRRRNAAPIVQSFLWKSLLECGMSRIQETPKIPSDYTCDNDVSSPQTSPSLSAINTEQKAPQKNYSNSLE